MTVYQEKAMRTCRYKDQITNDTKAGEAALSNGVMGLCGEAGECIDLVKKHQHQGHDLDLLKLVDELGDVMWYIALTCESVGITMTNVAERNIAKLQKRYPDGFSTEASVNRKE